MDKVDPCLTSAVGKNLPGGGVLALSNSPVYS